MNSKGQEDESKKETPQLDLCILCDATGSMDRWLKQVKNDITNIAGECQSRFGVSVKLAFVAYRDWSEDDYRIQTLDFTSNIEQFKNIVGDCEAYGGGDAAEDVFGGLEAAINLQGWSAPTRLIYHILDAPPHGTQYHELYEKKLMELRENALLLEKAGLPKSSEMMSPKQIREISDEDKNKLDQWPNGHPTDIADKRSHKSLIKALKKHNLRYVIGQKTHHTNKMVKLFRDYARSTQYEVDCMDAPQVQQLFPTIVAAVSKAIKYVKARHSVSQSVQFEAAALREFTVLGDFNIHVGIDFGTDGTAFAVAMKDESGKLRCFEGDKKTRTSILLSGDGQFMEFGDAALNKFMHSGDDSDDDDDDNPNRKRPMFFEYFKMALYEDDNEAKEPSNGDRPPNLNIREQLRDVGGQLWESDRILEEALKYMRREALNSKFIRRHKPDVTALDIHWILTVPAIWSEQAKKIMMEAAKRAGLICGDFSNQLTIAFEPDCAAISIQSALTERLQNDLKATDKRLQNDLKATDKRSQNDLKATDDRRLITERLQEQKTDNSEETKESIDDDILKGCRYLLLDLGGGTADIACREVVNKFHAKSIGAPTGGPWGSSYVDEAFQKLLSQLYGRDVMGDFKNECRHGYVAQMKRFRTAKTLFMANDRDIFNKEKNRHRFASTAIDEINVTASIQIDESRYTSIQLDFNFLTFLEDNQLKDKTLSFLGHTNLIKIGTRGKTKDHLMIHDCVWRYLFDTVVDPIVTHCQNLLKDYEDNACENGVVLSSFRYIVLVGGFSASKYLQSRLYHEFGPFSKYKLIFDVPPNPLLTVVSGAARMGLCPDFIISRTVAKTYGVATTVSVETFKNMHPNYEIPSANAKEVNRVFFPFITKNSLCRLDDPPIVHVFEAVDSSAKSIVMELHQSNDINPVFVGDTPLVRNEIPLSSPGIKLKVFFLFGGTYLRVFLKDPGVVKMAELTKDLRYQFDS